MDLVDGEHKLTSTPREKEPPSITIDNSKAQVTTTSTTQLPEHERYYLTGYKLWSVMLAISLAAMLMFLDMAIIVAAVPEITTVFSSLGDVGWYGAAYQLANAALQPLTGKLYANFGAKWLFLSFVLVFELGSLICALATSSTMLIVGRSVAGMGTSGLMSGGLTIVAAVAPLAKRPVLIGVVFGVGQLGLVVGPLVGGAFTEYVSWRWCFYINLPIGAITAVLLVFVHIPTHNVPPRTASIVQTLLTRLDLPGFILFAPAAIMFLLALEYSSEKFGWDGSQTIGLVVGAGVTLLAFLAWEYHVGDEAMIPLSLFRNRVMSLSSLLSIAVMCAAVLPSFYLPIYFQSVRGQGAMLSGVYMLPMILGQLFVGVAAGFIIGKTGYYLPWAVGGMALNAIGSGLITTFTPSTSTGEWVGYQIILGVGRGAAMQVPILAAQANLPPAQISVAMALLVFAQTFGGAVFLTIADLIFSRCLRTSLATEAPNVDVGAVIAAGGTGFRAIVPIEELNAVLEAYSLGVAGVFYLLVAMAGVGFLLSFGIGWKDVRERKVTRQTEKV